MGGRGVIGFSGFLLISVLVAVGTIGGKNSGQLGSWELVRGILLVGYYFLASVAYIIRYPAVYQGKGFKEVVLPFIVAFVFPLLIAASCERTIVDNIVPCGWELLWRNPGIRSLEIAGGVIGVAGIILTVCALWYLRRSFAITVSFRKIVADGPYRWLNHPMYCGEFMNLLGYWLGKATLIGAFFLLVFGLGLVARASIESKRLIQL